MTLAFDSRYKLYQPTVETTQFIVPFPIYSISDLRVVIGGVDRLDFTVAATFSGSVSTDAVITIVSGVAAGVDVEIYGDRLPRADSQYIANSPNLAAQLALDVDRLAAVQQEQRRDYGRTLKVSAGTAISELNILPGQLIKYKDDGTGFIGADQQIVVSALENSYAVRNVANATQAASLPDGTLVWLGSEMYFVDSTATSADSVTADLGVDGLVPAGNAYLEHFGGVGDASRDALASRAIGTDNSAAFQAAVNWLVPRYMPLHLKAAYKTDGALCPLGAVAGTGAQNPSLSIIGADRAKTGLVFTGSADWAFGISQMGGTVTRQYLGGILRDCFFYGPGDPTNDMHGPCLANQRAVLIENCVFHGWSGDCEPLWIYSQTTGGSFNGRIVNCWFGYAERPNNANDSNGRRTYDVNPTGSFWKMGNRRGPKIDGSRVSGGVNDITIEQLNVHGFLEVGLQLTGHGQVYEDDGITPRATEAGAANRVVRPKIWGNLVEVETEAIATGVTSTTISFDASLVNTTAGLYNDFRIRLNTVNGNPITTLIVRKVALTGDAVAAGTRTLTLTAALPTYDDLGFVAFGAGGGVNERPPGIAGTATGFSAGDEFTVLWGNSDAEARYDCAARSGEYMIPLGIDIQHQDRLHLDIRQIEACFQAVASDVFSITHHLEVNIQGFNSNEGTGFLCREDGTTSGGIPHKDLFPTITSNKDVTHGEHRFRNSVGGMMRRPANVDDNMTGYRGDTFQAINETGADLVEGDLVILKTDSAMKILKKADGTTISAPHVHVVVKQKAGAVYPNLSLVELADVNAHVPCKTWGEIERDSHLISVTVADVSADAAATGRLKMWRFTGTHDGTAFTNAAPNDIDMAVGVRNYLEAPEVWPPNGLVKAVPLEQYVVVGGSNASLKVCRIVT